MDIDILAVKKKLEIGAEYMQEHDLRQVAKTNAEYITPQALRQFLVSKITKDNFTVLEPAIGSGQLLFELKDKATAIDGFDINQISIETAKANFNEKLNAFNEDFITAEISKQYDYAIANYPFSLPPTQKQKEFIANDKFLKTFFSKEKDTNALIEMEAVVKPESVNGKLDFIFILKSFQHAQEGLYFAFPGIGYRGQEEKFRKYLIENKFIKEIGTLNNCKFDHTSISILFIHLTKTPNETTKSFTLDFKTNELIESIATFENNAFDFPKKEIEKEYFDPVETERQMRKSIIDNLLKELDFSQKIYNLDPEIRKSLPSIEEFKNEIILKLGQYDKD